MARAGRLSRGCLSFKSGTLHCDARRVLKRLVAEPPLAFRSQLAPQLEEHCLRRHQDKVIHGPCWPRTALRLTSARGLAHGSEILGTGISMAHSA
jgi:hypothetical protein